MMVRVNMTVKAMLKREKVLRGAGLNQANEHAERPRGTKALFSEFHPVTQPTANTED